jgi:hypothetical protein
MPELAYKSASKRRRKKYPGETFRYLHELFVFNVDLANRLVADGREPVEVEEQSVRMSIAERADINSEHVPKVDPTRPGVIAHVQYRSETGELFAGHVLIDGNHRAARCLELNRPFFAYLLTADESRAVLLESPASHSA